MFLPTNKVRSNSDSVTQVVEKLVGFGNETVYGILDYDGKRNSSGRIVVLGENRRYAIENYIFDPIFVLLLLLEQRAVQTSQFGIARDIGYIEFLGVSDEELQRCVDQVALSLDFALEDQVTCTTILGRNYLVPRAYLLLKGHSLEERLMKKWPQLGGIVKGSSADNVLKEYVIDHVIADYNMLISSDFVDVFSRIR